MSENRRHLEMNKGDKIYIAGHNGMVGSACLRLLKEQGYTNVITASRQELDLMDPIAVEQFFENNKPEYVILAAAKVGGIHANMTYPVEFLYNNLMIQNNIIKSAYENKVKKLCFLGSSCIYPRECPQPMKEEYLLTGAFEPTNEPYAIAKVAGIRLVQAFNKEYGFNGISVMPCNLYGQNDSYDSKNSHVLSAQVKRFVDAVDNDLPETTVWGSGIARREFLHVDDMAAAVVMLMQDYDSSEIINIGSGMDISIKELVELVALKAGYMGKILWDTLKPDGMLLKCMDVSKLNKLGFKPKISLEQGIDQMICDYRELKLKNLIIK
jgi:GDP-L-fucose synthase